MVRLRGDGPREFLYRVPLLLIMTSINNDLFMARSIKLAITGGECSTQSL